jgi:hypothetical protein
MIPKTRIKPCCCYILWTSKIFNFEGYLWNLIAIPVKKKSRDRKQSVAKYLCMCLLGFKMNQNDTSLCKKGSHFYLSTGDPLPNTILWRGTSFAIKSQRSQWITHDSFNLKHSISRESDWFCPYSTIWKPYK